ncbi:type II toxin-antitoxin system VapC family toxin [Chamaesiphon sp. OTE_20_metabat_361]|uniref:type II toxin-antitoxin system VapC family toxin n=1 Tax=Chamaesiphon sp. OTE_20_metabat_361 TaxID=2964689 RepID=UPI00286C5E68|nr:type II toxin-antitoxin system VapC family toxin [Chamaesiphon sp. OTE_20_metabat_361]
MNLLLDTHVLIWLVEGSDNLSQCAKQAIEDEQNSLSLSIASLWEMTIKMSLGKLQLGIPLDRIVESYLLPTSIEILPINLNHLLVLRDLPLHHRDPFDRILISQAQAEELTLVSGDRLFGDYLVQILW